jgi:hypothetical protein
LKPKKAKERETFSFSWKSHRNLVELWNLPSVFLEQSVEHVFKKKQEAQNKALHPNTFLISEHTTTSHSGARPLFPLRPSLV